MSAKDGLYMVQRHPAAMIYIPIMSFLAVQDDVDHMWKRLPQILEMCRLLKILTLLKTHLFKVAFTDK